MNEFMILELARQVFTLTYKWKNQS